MARSRNLSVLLMLLVPVVSRVRGDEPIKTDPVESPLPTIASRTEGMRQVDGFFTFYVDSRSGTIWLEITNWNEDFLYASGLSTGLGSNPVGLDRGQWGRERVVRFVRVGRRAFLLEKNVRYRAETENQAERRAVAESFADSVLWSAEIVAESGDRSLVDAATLLIRDSHRIVNRLKNAGEGSYALNKELSFVDLPRCRSFQRNTELAATVTFVGSEPGSRATDTAADGTAITFVLHYSLVQLPDDDYRPRRSDPRSGCITIEFADYAAPLDQPLLQRYIIRHRLKKADPSLDQSPPVKPIIYYLDPGTPQPVRDALLEGARWWNDGFEEAGFVDAFQVRLLPAGVDPMDVRFNVIQWVHRRTRGWSYGQSIVDPRTGEIIKGHVLLGSLRVRQDQVIIDGITANETAHSERICACCRAAGEGVDSVLAMLDESRSPLDVSLARLRQLSAHEVGHTLGFVHNFAASTYGDRASVMDYPAPRVRLRDDHQFDLSDAYGVGIGAWDRFLIRYAYTEFSDPRSEEEGLKALLEDADQRELLYLSDADARPSGAAHPLANLWDNGSDPVEQLKHIMKVRRLALDRLGPDDRSAGSPLADLEVVLTPVYLYHRYQVAATAKMIGGFMYQYDAPSGNSPPVTPVATKRQRAALEQLLKTLDADQLMIPDRLLELLVPKPYSSAIDRERFPKRTAMIFDPHAAAKIAAELVLSEILQPQRAARLAAYSQPDWNLYSVLHAVVDSIWNQPVEQDPRSAAIQEITQRVLIERIIALADHDATSHHVRAAALGELRSLRDDAEGQLSSSNSTRHRDHLMAMLDEIDRYLSRPHKSATMPGPITIPPGSPIGQPSSIPGSKNTAR